MKWITRARGPNCEKETALEMQINTGSGTRLRLSKCRRTTAFIVPRFHHCTKDLNKHQLTPVTGDLPNLSFIIFVEHFWNRPPMLFCLENLCAKSMSFIVRSWAKAYTHAQICRRERVISYFVGLRLRSSLCSPVDPSRFSLCMYVNAVHAAQYAWPRGQLPLALLCVNLANKIESF